MGEGVDIAVHNWEICRGRCRPFLASSDTLCGVLLIKRDKENTANGQHSRTNLQRLLWRGRVFGACRAAPRIPATHPSSFSFFFKTQHEQISPQRAHYKHTHILSLWTPPKDWTDIPRTLVPTNAHMHTRPYEHTYAHHTHMNISERLDLEIVEVTTSVSLLTSTSPTPKKIINQKYEHPC